MFIDDYDQKLRADPKRRNWVQLMHTRKGTQMKMIISGKELEHVFDDFADFCQENPVMKPGHCIRTGKEWITRNPRLLDLRGFLNYLKITREVWRRWREEGSYLRDAILLIEERMQDNQFQWGAAEVVNSKLVGSNLGIAEHQKVQSETTVKIEKDPFADLFDEIDDDPDAQFEVKLTADGGLGNLEDKSKESDDAS